MQFFDNYSRSKFWDNFIISCTFQLFMNSKSIKDIDDQTWLEFKSLAAKYNLKHGEFFKMLLKDYEKDRQEFWNKILNGEKILDDDEANELLKLIMKGRKEYGFRL